MLGGDVSRNGLVPVVKADLIVEPVGEEKVAVGELHLGRHEPRFEGQVEVFVPLVGEGVGEGKFVLNVKERPPLQVLLQPPDSEGLVNRAAVEEQVGVRNEADSVLQLASEADAGDVVFEVVPQMDEVLFSVLESCAHPPSREFSFCVYRNFALHGLGMNVDLGVVFVLEAL